MTQYAYHRPAPGSKTWNLIRHNGERWETTAAGLTFEEAHKRYEEQMADQPPVQGELEL